MTIIYFLIIIAVIIAIHEFGHMLAAKIFGCYVTEYAIGFGPTLFGAGLALLPIAVSGGIHMDGFCDVVDAQ